jgi:hypothetical protein
MGGSGLSGTADKEDYFFSDLPDGLTDNDLLGPAGGKTFLDDLAGFE